MHDRVSKKVEELLKSAEKNSISSVLRPKAEIQVKIAKVYIELIKATTVGNND